MEQASCDGPSSFQRDGLGCLDNRGVERVSCDDPSIIQRDGLGCLDNRPKSAGKAGQPSLAASWALNPLKTLLDEPFKKARASFSQMRAEGWFAEETLVGGMVFKVEKGAS